MKYSFISFLIAWIFPTKDDRAEFRIFCRELDNRKKVQLIQSRYPKVIEHLQKKYKNKQKLKVVFLNSENSKWSYQSLYEKFKENPNFEVQVLITVLEIHLKKKYKFLEYEKQARKSYNFFAEKGINVAYAFDFKNNKYIDLKEFSPDIIFYEQPWSLPKEQSIIKTSKYALCFYSSYGSAITNGKNEYCDILFKEVYKYFVDNPVIEDILIWQHNFNPSNLSVAGSLKLDAYLKPIDETNIIWKTKGKKRIIYAPHHSFSDNSTLRFGTFTWNYKFFYNFAKEHQEYEFIFKPHPELKRQIIRQGLMSIGEMTEYFKMWENLPNAQVYEFGNYFDMFRTSDLLITDCNSFLYEYLPTKKPVIHLIGEHSVGHNEFGQKIISGYYAVRNMEELQSQIDLILFKNKDPLLSVREEVIEKILVQPEGGVAKFIEKFITNLLTTEKLKEGL